MRQRDENCQTVCRQRGNLREDTELVIGMGIARRIHMTRRTILVMSLVVGFPHVLRAQSVCSDSEVVFVGRAEAPVTFHVSGEAEIEKARKLSVLADEEFERLKTSSADWMRDPRVMELTIRMIKAKDAWNMRKAMYPPPHNITFIPLAVTRPIRGVKEATLMLLARPHLPAMTPGEEYVVYGARSRQLIPPFPEMGDLASLPDYVEGLVEHVSTALKQPAFLAAIAPGATVAGTLRMHSFGDGGMPPPLPGIRIRLSSGGQVVETVTRDDGRFFASGVAPGDLDITAALDPDLTIVEGLGRTLHVCDGGYTTVNLRAAVNGRVRGRIVSATGGALDNVNLNLRVARDNRRAVYSHDSQFSTKARADGSFEFSGVSAGTYLLSAWVPKSDGKSRLVTYFRGTDDVDAATPIDVGKATLHEGFDFIVITE